MSKKTRRYSDTGLEPIDKVIGEVFRQGKFGRSAEVAKLWSIWEEVVGEDIAQHCVPQKICDGKLYIGVDSPIWCQQLDLLRDEIRKKVSEIFKEADIRNIVFRVAILR